MTTPVGIPALTFEFADAAQAQIMPILENQKQLELSLSGTKEKEPGHMAYAIDDLSHQILVDIVQKAGLECNVFSEEGGWTNFGVDPVYKIVCDPFCNTSLAMRSFRESAAAICMVDRSGAFVSCAIADLNTRRIFYADQSGAHIYSPDANGGWRIDPAVVSNTRALDDAFIVVSALKQRRREWLVGKQFMSAGAQIHGLDGAIFIARLASGYIDAYMDPSVGQPLYEVPCLEMVKRAGGTVTDMDGKPFEVGRLIAQLEDEPKARYRFVAAATPELHSALIDVLK